jgi:hypothetical protein
MNLAQRIVENGEAPRDSYELAGCARFTPRVEDVVAGLQRLTAENAPYIAHWNQQTRRRGQELQRQIETALTTFSSVDQRQRYDDSLMAALRQAYQTQIAGQSGEALKRWLRLTQNVHSSRIEPIARKLLDDKSTDQSLASHESARPVAAAVPAQVIEAPAPVSTQTTSARQATPVANSQSRSARRPPPRRAQPDYFALPWIVGSAAVTAVVCLALLLYFFRDRFGGEKRTVAQSPPGETSPLESSPEPMPQPVPVETTPPVVPNETSPSQSTTTEPSPSTPPGTTTPATAEPTPVKPTPTQTGPAPPPTPPSPTPTPTPTPTPAPMPMPATPQAPQPPGARQTVEFGRAVHSLAWDSSGKLLALAGEGGDVLIWDTSTGAEARRLQDSFPSATCVAFNSRSVGVTTSDNRVIVWNAHSGKIERSLRHADLNDPRTLAWIPNTSDGQIVIGDGAGAIRTFSLATSNPVAAIDIAADAGAVQSLVVSTKRSVAVSAHLDGTVVLWNLNGKAALKCLASSESSFIKALQQPAAASSKGAEISYCGHEICYDVDLNHDESLLATAATDLELWELDSARHLVRRRLLPGVPGAKAYRVAKFSADGSLLATGNAEGTLSIVDVANWTVVVQEKLPAAVICLNWHRSDSRMLAVGLENGQAIVMPLAKNVSSLKATPDFDAEKLLVKAKELVEDENWYDATRLMAVLTAYQLPLSTRSEVDRLRGLARKGIQSLVDEIDPKTSEPDEIADALFDLQLAIDSDPLGKLAKDARAKLKQFPARTPATLMKVAAAENAATKSTTKTSPKSSRRFGRP